MDDKKIKEVKVSAKTDPKLLATSFKYSINEGYIIKAYALGEAVKVLFKAIAMLNLFDGKENSYDFQPILEYKKDSYGIIKNFIVCKIEKKE